VVEAERDQLTTLAQSPPLQSTAILAPRHVVLDAQSSGSTCPFPLKTLVQLSPMAGSLVYGIADKRCWSLED